MSETTVMGDISIISNTCESISPDEDESLFMELDITQNLIINEELFNSNNGDGSSGRANIKIIPNQTHFKKKIKKLGRRNLSDSNSRITRASRKVVLEDQSSIKQEDCLKDQVQMEISDENYFELRNMEDVQGCSELQLEYGSGVSIYESVEACDSENSDGEYVPTKPKRKSKNKKSLFRCKKCIIEFRSREELLKHRKIHSKRGPYECNQCDAIYYNPIKYHCHMSGHNEVFSCLECKKTFVRLVFFKRHLKQCHKMSNPHICIICGAVLLTSDALDDHLSESHPEEAEALKSYFKQCQDCRYTFVTELSYLNHLKSAPYKCPNCDYSAPCSNKLNSHTSSKHKPQLCQICNKTFKAFDTYTHHMQYYHTEKKLDCPFCDEKFRVKSRLLIHIDVNHTEGHNYQCNQCDYTAKNYASVSRHRRIAHLPKSETLKYTCEVCGKGFLVPSRLKVHMKSHSTTKPHVCKLCGRGYKHEYLLKRHIKNPSQCLRVLFPNGSRLERKGKRRCDLCSIDFTSPEQLACHMIEVHDIKVDGNVIDAQTFGSQAEFSNVILTEQSEEDLSQSGTYIEYIEMPDGVKTFSTVEIDPKYLLTHQQIMASQ